MGFTTAWLLWISMFIAVEGAALLNRQGGDTLSEHVWKWFTVKGKSRGWTLRRGVLATFLAWLAGHLTLGIWSL